MSDAAQTQSGQTTTETQPFTPPQAGNDERIAQLEAEREQWRTLALSQQPQQTYEQPAQQRAFSYQQDAVPSYPPSSLLIENPDEYDRRMQAYLAYRDQQTLSQVANFAAPQLADSGKFMSQNDPAYKDVWSKYAGEIEREMVQNNVPQHARTTQAWNLIAGIVRGRHVDELANEIAERRLASGGFGTESASNVGSGASGGGDSLAAFWSSDHPWVARAKNAGMTLAGLRQHIASQHLSEEQWLNDIKRSRSFSAEAA